MFSALVHTMYWCDHLLFPFPSKTKRTYVTMGGGSFLKLVWPVANHWRIQRSDFGGSKSFIGAELTYSHFSLSPRIWTTSSSKSRVSIFFILSFYFYILCCPVTGSLMSALPSFSLERCLLHIGIEVPILTRAPLGGGGRFCPPPREYSR